MIVASLLIVLGAYLALGFLFAVPFVLIGVKRIDPHAAHGSWGFRILIFPGTLFLWPLLAKRWWFGAGEPPEQDDAHRRASHCSADFQSDVSQACSLRGQESSERAEQSNAQPTTSRRYSRLKTCATKAAI